MAAASALHRALRDFGERPASVPRPGPAAVEPAAPSFSRADLDRAVCLAEARLREDLAREHGAAAERAVREAVAQALAAERLQHAETVERITGEQGAAMAAAIAAAFASLKGEVCEAVGGSCARLLAPVLAEDGARRAVDALAQALRDAFADGGAFRVALSGPAALRARLLAELADLPLQWQEREADGFDLRAAFGSQVLETRLGEWAAALKGFEA